MARNLTWALALAVASLGCGEGPHSLPPAMGGIPAPPLPAVGELGVGLHPDSYEVTVRRAGSQVAAEAVVPDAVEAVTAWWAGRLRTEATVTPRSDGLAQGMLTGLTPSGDRVVVSVEGVPAGRSSRTTVLVTRRRE